jgi:hypothetical protein
MCSCAFLAAVLQLDQHPCGRLIPSAAREAAGSRAPLRYSLKNLSISTAVSRFTMSYTARAN